MKNATKGDGYADADVEYVVNADGDTVTVLATSGTGDTTQASFTYTPAELRRGVQLQIERQLASSREANRHTAIRHTLAELAAVLEAKERDAKLEHERNYVAEEIYGYSRYSDLPDALAKAVNIIIDLRAQVTALTVEG